ncbi:MBL fold metallo-hydrolase RNA specificity domain-containing protein [Georgenia satyanarayanai]|uniref:MBL fold metallo-hydrolase RNA specificity domain-containing protein n=1 Tax=Georgenia satyanarayanai TaxID=860221 RepID=UPI001264AF76|nr:MBL fold metallo-hydrolase [Georgenia satyanarayanai]
MGEPVVLTFLGGAGTVTGSKFLVDGPGGRRLVDCGLFQGERQWRRRNWEPFPVDPASIGDVVLTHCHLDHCGYLPVLVREGFGGPVRMTEGTAALTEIVLRDSAHLNERDAENAARGGYSRHDPPLPLYTTADTERAVARFAVIPFDHTVQVGGDGSTLRLGRAGHVLGSATVHLRTGSADVLFSGDLGRPTHPVLRPRADPPAARTVVIESTYGDRLHPRVTGAPHAALAAAIRRTVERGGSVLVPAFAVDRTELVLAALADLLRRGDIPDVPVHVDSPMALAALAVYRAGTVRAELREDLPALIDLPHLHAARTVEESIALNTPRYPCIIVSSSGMATGGRVVHHLRHLLPDRHNTVVLTGYQAAGTRGRALQDGAAELKMLGRYVPVRAEVVEDEEFSVHADAEELLDWLHAMPDHPETVYVVHGETAAAQAFARRVRSELGSVIAVPAPGEKVRVD